MDKFTLIYDGECGFCNASLIWAYKNLSIMPAAVPYQDVELEKYGLSFKQVESAVYLLDETTGSQYRGHSAIGKLFALQEKKRYRILGRVMSLKILFPMFALGYRIVASNRRYLPGATEACGRRPAQG